MRHVCLILRHDLRLTLREMKSHRLRSGLLVTLLLLALLVGHGIVLGLCAAFGPPPATVEGVIWLVFTALMVGVAVQQSIALLFVRGDLDLLLASPVSPRAVLTARMLAIAAAAGGGVALFLVPLINGPLLMFSPRYTAAYLVWVLLALLATSFGVALALLLVRWFGVERGRKIAQIAGALLGASIYLGTQAPALMPASVRPTVAATLGDWAQTWMVTLPAQAGRGDLPSIAWLAFGAGGALVATALPLGRLFLRGAQDAEVRPTRRRRSRPPEPWTRGPFAVAVRKDVRLILRDPMLLAQLLPSAVYLVPAALASWRLLGPAIPATAAVVIGGQFATLLTRIAADGEECWDLIQGSPASEAAQRLAKMTAALPIPVGLVVGLCAITATGGRPGVALLAGAIATLVSAGCARAQVASIQPMPRRDVLKSRRPASLSASLVNVLLVASGAGTVALAAANRWGLAAAGGIITVIAVAACFVLLRFKETRFART